MQFTKEDKILIKNLFELKGYTAKQLVRKFPSKGWNVGSVYKLLQKLWVTGTVDRCPGSGRRRIARTADNVDLVDELMLSQEDKPQSHRTVREISRETAFIGRRLPVYISFTKICVSSALRSDAHRSCLTPTAKLACRDRGCCFGSSQNML